jgi:predicted ATPase/class 3 adenylate cyclase
LPAEEVLLMPALPSGTVTILFTDIEGSTRLWEQHPAAMQDALVQHDALLRAAVTVHHGHVVKTTGDGIHAMFASAGDAVLAAQRAVQAQTWGAVGAMRVRMALHTGEVVQRDGDYFAPALNRAARLMAAGHGGQILLSAATYELVRDQLPDGVALRDLGEHRLKDLLRPEHIFQLGAPDLPGEFAPLKTLEGRALNLPVQQTAFIGRERELAALRVLLGRDRHGGTPAHLVTLTGPGGTGKTRLALQVAAELLDAFADGVHFVSLAPVSEPVLVASAIVRTLGLRESGEQPLEDLLTGYLRDKELLLVLDNFEQVVGAAPLVGRLLAAGPRLQVLVTSRVVLRLYGEQEYPVPPLALPALDHLPEVAVLSQYEAVALFIQRALLTKPDFVVTNATAPAVAEICVRLDGLPLAIELAAARVKLLPPPALLTRLESRLTVLTGGARDLPARHQTLRAAIDWSYDLLDPGEQALFAWLAVFVGGCTLDAVEDVCARAGGLSLDVLDGLGSLVDKSLVRQQEDPEGTEPRFTMLETVHEYARERLVQSGQAALLSGAHAQHFLALAEEAEPYLTGTQQAMWLAGLDAEHDNLRAVLRWAQESGEVLVGLRLAAALGRFWNVRGPQGEGRRWLEAFLATEGTQSEDGVDAAVRARALIWAAALSWGQADAAGTARLAESGLALSRALGDTWGVATALLYLAAVATFDDLPHAMDLFAESLALYQELGDKQGSAFALRNLATAHAFQGDYAQATALHEESLGLSRDVGDKAGIATALMWIGSNTTNDGHYVRATVLFEESLALYRELGDTWGVASCLNFLGDVAYGQGDVAQSEALYRESLALFREQNARIEIALCLYNLAYVAHKQSRAVQAKALLAESLALCRDIGITYGIAARLNLAAMLCTTEDAMPSRLERAARLFGAAAALYATVGVRLGAWQAELDREVAAVHTALGDGAFAAAWAAGQALSLEQAIAMALEDSM